MIPSLPTQHQLPGMTGAGLILADGGEEEEGAYWEFATERPLSSLPHLLMGDFFLHTPPPWIV